MLDIFAIFVADNRTPMQNDNNITLLEQQMANNEDICCSCGNITSFPQAFFDRFHVTDVGIIVCTSGSFSFTCEGVEYQVATGEIGRAHV